MGRILSIVLLAILFAAASALAAPPIPLNYQISSPSTQIQNEEQVFVSPLDSNIIIANWRDFRLGYRQVGLGRSTNGGQTWSDSLISIVKYDRQSDPTLDVSRTGIFYSCVLDYSSLFPFSAISMCRSTDGGVSWSGLAVIEGPPGDYFEDKQFITLDRTNGTYDGNVYIAWARFAGDLASNRIFAARSIDGGLTFQDTLEIGPIPDFNGCGVTTAGGQFAQPIVGSDGSVYVFWVGADTVGCNLYNAMLMTKSTDGGASYSPRKRVRPTFGNYYYVEGGIDVYNAPSGAADITGGPFDGSLYIAYANMDTTNTENYDFNIEFIRSTDNGTTWTEPLYINDDSTGPGARIDQFHPWLYCNQEGTLVCIWYDQRVNSYDITWTFDVFAAYSFDGGLSFTENHRISSVSIDPGQLGFSSVNVDFNTNSKFPVATNSAIMAGRIAEYIGVTAFKDHVNAVWTDTRNYNQDVYGANWVIPLTDGRLVSPKSKDTVATDQPTLTWATSWHTNDDRYRLEVSQTSDFATLYESIVLDTAAYTPPAAWGEGRYYWRVKPFRIIEGDSAEYSETWNFLVDAIPCYDPDEDGFGSPDHPENACATDNCPDVYNPTQADANNDGIGDACCCNGIRGNVNGDPEDKINIGDITFAASWLFGIPQGTRPPCPAEANANGDPDEAFNISDVTYLVKYLFGIPPGNAPPACP